MKTSNRLPPRKEKHFFFNGDFSKSANAKDKINGLGGHSQLFRNCEMRSRGRESRRKGGRIKISWTLLKLQIKPTALLKYLCPKSFNCFKYVWVFENIGREDASNNFKNPGKINRYVGLCHAKH